MFRSNTVPFFITTARLPTALAALGILCVVGFTGLDLAEEGFDNAVFELGLAGVGVLLGAAGFWLLQNQDRRLQALAARLQDTLDGVESILTSLPLPVVGRDSSGRIAHWNTAAENYFGWTTAEAIGQTLPIHRSYQHNRAAEVLARVSAGSIATDVVLAAYRRNGVELRVSMASAPWRMANGNVGSLCVYTDLTGTLRDADQRYEAAVRQREALIREVHHRMKNTLQGVANLIAGAIGEHPALRGLLRDSWNQIMAIARVHGLLAHASAPLKLTDVVAEVHASVTAGFSAAVALKHETNLEARVASAEIVPLTLIVNELLTNAVKHAAGGAAVSPTEIAVTGSSTAAVIEIRNPGTLRDSVDFATRGGLGDGLTLIGGLLPAAGAALEYVRGPGTVTARLTLSTPVLQGQRHEFPQNETVEETR